MQVNFSAKKKINRVVYVKKKRCVKCEKSQSQVIHFFPPKIRNLYYKISTKIERIKLTVGVLLNNISIGFIMHFYAF